MVQACEEHNAALSGSAPPFRLFVITNVCCGLNLTDAVSLYARFHNSSCALQLDERPVFSAWSAVNSRVPFPTEAARWEAGFFSPIAAMGLPRPFFLPFIYPANYTNGETPTEAQQTEIVEGFGSAMDGLWYWGCAPLADKVVNSSRATVAACRRGGKYVATPVSGPYSPHTQGNNRYSTSAGGRAVIEAWTEKLVSQPDMVIFTTWNDLGEHHYVGSYNLQRNYFDEYNTFPHLAYLQLSSYFIEWYKLPTGSPPPEVRNETLFYFYNSQPVNNTCPGDPLGPGSVNTDAEFPAEDMLYATVLLREAASLVMTSGAGSPTPSEASFSAPGLHSFKVPRQPGLQQLKVLRGGLVLADVQGAELVNASTVPAVAEVCNRQTFTGFTYLATGAR